MNAKRKAALIAATVVALGGAGVGVAHSQVATPKPTAKPKATTAPKTTPKPATKVKAATAAKPVVSTPRHTG